MQTPLELAKGLQHSNIPEVADIAKALIKLNDDFGELRSKHMKTCTELVILRHEKTLKRLAESGD